MPTFAFKQLDVFSNVPLKGNPLAVVLGQTASVTSRWLTLPVDQPQ
jgi:predicted PhzF superfamily epimerase YddE/YHI9